MKILIAPAVFLMQRLRLLPKFALVALLFAAPLALLGSLLLSELNRSISATRQERVGVQQVRRLEEVLRLMQRHRALRHMQLAGNAAAAAPALQTRDAIDRAMAADAAGGDPRQAAAWRDIVQGWAALETNPANAKAKDSYAAHTALVERLIKLIASTADRYGLTLDPALDSMRLGVALTQTFPELADGLAHLAGRGAAFIDTGLLEANEDLMLHSIVMVTRRDLARVPAQFDAVFGENPSLRARLKDALTSVDSSLAFLDRSQDEVVNSFNQTSGMQFFDAGGKSIDALYASAQTVAGALDGLLQQRIERDTQRRDLIAALVLATLALAAYLLAGFYASFSHEVKRLEEAVARTADGDLGNRVASDARDEIGCLVNAFGAMNAGLAQLVAEVRAGSETVTRTAQSIASGSSALAARTEAQASSLQQTASSMEELTSIVCQNGEHAGEASRVATAAVDVARGGGAAVDQVVNTMTAIKNSSIRISDIIRLIDDIAFQTNILALNAAVEAARAGEHGRGFAVVAGEVRALARRSADAAKEIKTLIENSVEQIEHGNRLAGAAGGTMADIIASIRRVAELLNGIAAAGKEQSAGIEQVNQAITQMDEVTQRNATLVEEAAAAAEAQREQAARLAQAVAAFRLEPESEPASAIVTRLTDRTAALHAPRRRALAFEPTPDGEADRRLRA